MYNRYIPQPDGSWSRNRMPDPAAAPRNPTTHREPPPQNPRPPAPTCDEPPRPSPQPCTQPHQSRPYPPQHCRPNPKRDGGIGSFLRQLLPRNLDTEDLLIILLLLLMSGDCAEDQNTALLTLAIYLFL